MDKQAPHCELTGQVGLAGTPPGGQRNLRAIIAVFLILAWRNADSLGLDRFAFPMVRNRFAHGHGTGTGRLTRRLTRLRGRPATLREISGGTTVEQEHRIVAAVDGSPSSMSALRWAIRQAGLTGASVDAVTAWHYPAAADGYGWTPAGMATAFDFKENAEKVLADAISTTCDPGSAVRVRALVVEGEAAQVLLAAADGADLLVVGSRGHGGFTEALLGSVSQHCVHHAHCPVVVIRGQEQD